MTFGRPQAQCGRLVMKLESNASVSGFPVTCRPCFFNNADSLLVRPLIREDAFSSLLFATLEVQREPRSG